MRDYLLMIGAVVFLTSCIDDIGVGALNQDAGGESADPNEDSTDSDTPPATTGDTGGGTDTDNKTDGSGSSSGLVDITFISTSVTENGAPVSLFPGTTLQLQFQDDGDVSAYAGCNSLFGSYVITGGILVVSQMGMTEMFCGQEKSDQDEWFSAFLTSSPTLSLSGDTLTLRSVSAAGDVTVIVFMDEEVATPDLSLTGQTWIVDTIIDGGAASNTAWTSPATLDFGPDGVLQFFTGCNSGSADYVVESTLLMLVNTSWTEKGCADAAAQGLETAVLNVLGANESITWDIDVDRLTLNVSGAGLGLAAEQ
jgi:heat shock protein HslJ